MGRPFCNYIHTDLINMKKETDSKQEKKRKNTIVKLQKEYKLSNYILS